MVTHLINITKPVLEYGLTLKRLNTLLLEKKLDIIIKNGCVYIEIVITKE